MNSPDRTGRITVTQTVQEVSEALLNQSQYVFVFSCVDTQAGPRAGESASWCHERETIKDEARRRVYSIVPSMKMCLLHFYTLLL